MMKESVNPVDAHIGKKKKGEHTENEPWPT